MFYSSVALVGKKQNKMSSINCLRGKVYPMLITSAKVMELLTNSDGFKESRSGLDELFLSSVSFAVF